MSSERSGKVPTALYLSVDESWLTNAPLPELTRLAVAVGVPLTERYDREVLLKGIRKLAYMDYLCEERANAPSPTANPVTSTPAENPNQVD